MTTNQENIISTINTKLGISNLTYNESMLKLFSNFGITNPNFNSAFIEYLQLSLNSTKTNLNDLLGEYATQFFNGNVNSINDFTKAIPNLYQDDLVAWYDSNDLATITKSSNLVSEWKDKSGNNNHATQSTGGIQPTYSINGFNNKPCMIFDGAGDGFNLQSTLSGTKDIMVVEQGSGFLLSSETQRLIPYYILTGAMYWQTAPDIIGTIVTWRDETTQVISNYALNSVNGDYSIRRNGQTVLAGTGKSKNNNINRIALRWDSSTNAPTWDGKICEILVFNNNNSTRRIILEQYLATKWGITLV